MHGNVLKHGSYQKHTSNEKGMGEESWHCALKKKNLLMKLRNVGLRGNKKRKD